MIRTLTVGIVLSAMFLGLPVQAQAPNLAEMDTVQRALPDGPVALVDGKAVSREDFLFLYQSQLARMGFATRGKELGDDIRVKAGISALAELVQREILSQLAERKGLTVSQAEVADAYAKQMKLLIKEFSQDSHTPTEDEILKRSGQTKDDALRDLHKALMVEKATKSLADEKKLVVTDKEARDFYDNNKERFQRPSTLHLKDIYMRPGENPAKADEKAWANAEKRIREAEARFKVGESFEGVAKAMSDGKFKENGGDMGALPVQALPPVYLEQAKNMKAGDTSAPFKSDQGWHIIRLVAREGEEDVPFEKAQDFIKQRLLQVKTVAAMEEYCQPIMADADRVQIFLQLHAPAGNASEVKAAAPKAPEPKAAEQKAPEETKASAKKAADKKKK